MTKQEKVNKLLDFFSKEWGEINDCDICFREIKDEEYFYRIGCWDCFELNICEDCYKDLKEEKNNEKI